MLTSYETITKKGGTRQQYLLNTVPGQTMTASSLPRSYAKRHRRACSIASSGGHPLAPHQPRAPSCRCDTPASKNKRKYGVAARLPIPFRREKKKKLEKIWKLQLIISSNAMRYVLPELWALFKHTSSNTRSCSVRCTLPQAVSFTRGGCVLRGG